MALTCLSSAYLGATTFFKKPQSLLWMTQCLLISFFWSKTITAWGYLTYLSNLTSFNNNNKAMQDKLLYSFFFLSAMLIWSLLWAAPHRSAGMAMVCCMEEGHGFKLQADCQPVFCCLGQADCDWDLISLEKGKLLSHWPCLIQTHPIVWKQLVYHLKACLGKELFQAYSNWCKQLYHMILMKLK